MTWLPVNWVAITQLLRAMLLSPAFSHNDVVSLDDERTLQGIVFGARVNRSHRLPAKPALVRKGVRLALRKMRQTSKGED